MGIDIYMRWPDMTEEDMTAQFCGYSTTNGHSGYLREAYHGGPYMTEVLVPESWDFEQYAKNEEGELLGVPIDAQTLMERCGAAISVMKARYAEVYKHQLHDASPEIQSIRDFVELAARKQLEHGQPVLIYNSY